METMEKITYEIPKTFVPTEVHIEILQAVADRRSCQIGDVVNTLSPDRSESSIRSGVHLLLSRGCLDAGKSSSKIVLRLTSRGRLLLPPGDAR